MDLLVLIVDLIRWTYNEIRFHFYFKPLIRRVLGRNHLYFIHLRTDRQDQFFRKVVDNFRYFKFVGHGTKLSDPQKIIIASAAAQMVLFLPDEALSYFTKIIVYPDFYYSRLTGRMHKGEVNPGMRVIVFSKRGIIEGNKVKNDGINLLHHEFAHALWLEHKLVGHQYDVLSGELLTEFEKYAEAEIDAIQNVESHFFRAYAFTNMAEFFAVAVENFFERPREFQQHQPQLFDILVGLLKQNPLAMAPKAFARMS